MSETTLESPRRSTRARVERLPATRTEVVFRWAVRVAVVIILAFLAVPIIIVVAESFNGVNYLVFPLKGVSLSHYRDFLADPTWRSATMTSARIATTSALLATVLGTMAAWALARSSSRARTLVYALLYSPAIVPIIVLALSFYHFFADLHLIGSWLAVAAANAVMGMPVVLVAVSASLRHLDPDLENAARSLGASPAKALRFVTFPRIVTGIAAGAIFAFVSAFDESVVILFIAGSGSITLPRKLWDSVRNDLTPTLAVAGTILIAVCITLFLIAEILTTLREKRASR